MAEFFDFVKFKEKKDNEVLDQKRDALVEHLRRKPDGYLIQQTLRDFNQRNDGK